MSKKAMALALAKVKGKGKPTKKSVKWSKESTFKQVKDTRDEESAK